MAAPNQVLVIITQRRIPTAPKGKLKEELIKLVDETITHLQSNHKTNGLGQLLVFSVTSFKIDQSKNQNRSTNKVQNLGNERRYIYKGPRQDSGQRNISYTRYPKKCFTQTYRDLYGDAMLVLTWMSSNMADGNQQKHLISKLENTIGLPLWITNVNFVTFNKFKRTL